MKKYIVTNCDFNIEHYPNLIGKEFYKDGPFTEEENTEEDEDYYIKFPYFRPKKEMNTVDHINKDKLDNRRSNLRICTQKQNGGNASKAKTRKFTSKYKGVYFDKERNKWIAKIKRNHRNIWIGRFDTEKEAAKAYNIQARIIFREFAELNKL